MLHSLRVHLILLIATLTLLASACASSEESSSQSCSRTSDCTEINEICVQGECVDRNSTRSCESATDCLATETCEGGICTESVTDTSMPMPDGTDTTDTTPTPDMMGDVPPDMTPDVPEDLRDTTGPRIISRSPDIDEADVLAAALVSVGFDEEVIPETVMNPSNFQVWNFSRNMALPATTAWDAATMTATITPTEALLPLSPYRVTVTSNILDRAGNAAQSSEWRFTTGNPSASAMFYQELALAYAPTIHQDADSNSLDIPLRFDFDGDLNIRNNGTNALAGAGSADPAAYYHVSETESHYFVHYVLYYPIYQLSDTSAQLSHATNGVLVLVRKNGERLGALQLFQTYSSSPFASNSEGRVQSFLPDCSGGEMVPYCEAEATVKLAGLASVQIPAATYADDVDSRHIPLYVQPRNHSLCHFEYRDLGTGDYCVRGGQDYPGSFFAVLTPHTEAGSPSAPDFNTGLGTYALLPLDELLWINRASLGDTDDTFYLDTDTYEGSVEFSIADNAPITIPRSLNTPADQRSDNPGRISPYAWNAAGAGAGAWMIDPAHTLATFFNMPAGEDYFFLASRYCYNVFAGIDRTADEPACQPVAP